MDWVLVTQIITFVVFLWILYRLTGASLVNLFRQRADRIESSLRAAEESQRRAAETQQETQRQLEQAHAEAESIRASAQKAAEVQRHALLEQAQGDAEALMQRARDGIQRERQAAIDELRREAGRLAITAATKVVNESLDDQTHGELADRTIAEVGGLH